MNDRPGLTVTSVGAEAAAEVHAVVRAAFGARPPLDPPADALAETPDSIAAALGRGRGLLARLGGQPVGAVLLDPHDDTVFLRRFGVHPEAQGKGVASALLEAAVAHAPAQQTMTVLARPEMPRTVDFWRSKGFCREVTVGPYLQLFLDLPTEHVVKDGPAMQELGRRVGRLLEAGDVLVLSGELGAGKTTFTQGLGEGLGVRGGVTSPTFVIARVHPSLVDGPDLVHVDAYRLGGIEELDDLDLDTSLDEAVTVVEWGAGVAEGLATRRLEVRVTRALGGGEAPVSLEDHDPRVVELRWVREQ
ncbi:tRNA (adenosine(37)-N6)-threonylcarbamoyltransferase complex ATPase subunit type 1 TsaE [Nocardioides jishulii]|uniref:tRNA threonylcarbamoyladenosine biosynthesis protein TsaE n=1 Tax=Nocardioides jishulii TaxID=2575440 RepID=A0A4U2YX39_9ACTN|nr:tRNA (adenosine(37)-N6)-threonylcarbamoyltransferase complex ATPase subunit type 1 TsaE [Nocardioides jishulii]QCX28366.1 tRNA (adenosine(37)-N6)-threonylcarbamoyltransferase complex ATPase subunit type 1 TsaE [Nocardioides jishulii]TKI64741.1 tRNA (adenosine(37)-N6)-threonylcarbamoyltransferase complex ATPase subunit type 1 TsaE [Nocardioides jishulii]